jgi:hypothetical protein
MRILHLSDYSLSGAPYRLSQVQRLGGLDSRLITFDNQKERGGHRRFPGDVLVSDDPALIEELVRAATVIHYHNQWRELQIFQKLPWIWDLARAKPSVIQFHSWTRHTFQPQLEEPSLTKLVCAQYQVRLYPECMPVPIALPIDDPLHQPTWIENDPPVILYTPSELVRTGWNDKGFAVTRKILEEGRLRYELIHDAQWEHVMRRRQQSDIAIDEVVTGSYHTCSLESLSTGLAVIAGLDSQTVDALEAVTGTREHPWIVAKPDTLFDRLSELVQDEGYRKAKRRESRAYMERYWSVPALNARYEIAYRAALQRGPALSTRVAVG